MSSPVGQHTLAANVAVVVVVVAGLVAQPAAVAEYVAVQLLLRLAAGLAFQLHGCGSVGFHRRRYLMSPYQLLCDLFRVSFAVSPLPFPA